VRPKFGLFTGSYRPIVVLAVQLSDRGAAKASQSAPLVLTGAIPLENVYRKLYIYDGTSFDLLSITLRLRVLL